MYSTTPAAVTAGAAMSQAHGGIVSGIRAGKGGGDEGTRTPDPRDANAVLSQLSYIPTGGRVYGTHLPTPLT